LFAHGQAVAIAISNLFICFLASLKSRMFLPVWYRLTLVVLEKRSLNYCLTQLFGDVGRMFAIVVDSVLESVTVEAKVCCRSLQLRVSGLRSPTS